MTKLDYSMNQKRFFRYTNQTLTPSPFWSFSIEPYSSKLVTD